MDLNTGVQEVQGVQGVQGVQRVQGCRQGVQAGVRTLTTVTGCLKMEAVWRMGGTRFAVWVLAAQVVSII